jgi:hypothetical protein
MQGPDGRFDTSLYSFESAPGVETIFEIGVTVGASEKAKGVSEGFAGNQSIVDRPSERETEDMMRWEGGRAQPWKRSKGGWRTLVCGGEVGVKGWRAVEWFLRHHTEKKTCCLYSAVGKAEMR